jgi:hypothetical protein
MIVKKKGKSRLMKKLKRIEFLVGILLLSCACAPLWNRASQRGLQSDLDNLLGNDKIELEQCRMIASTRAAACQFNAEEDIISNLAEKLNLNMYSPAADAEVDQMVSVWMTDPGCSEMDVFTEDNQEFLMYYSARRAPELVVPGGSSFEYLLLFYNPNDGQACVQVSYAYG